MTKAKTADCENRRAVYTPYMSSSSEAILLFAAIQKRLTTRSMTHRALFWKHLGLAALACVLLASCMAPPVRSQKVQRAPNITHPLVTSESSIAPGGAPEDEELDLSNQKIVKIGLLLPLTGRSAELGRALQDAATVSLFDKYARISVRDQTVRVELLPKDTGDTPDQAARAMQQAIDEGAAFIIGPLFADATSSAAPIARAKNISVLSLSNTRTQASPGTYMFGFSPAEQADRVVSYAIANGKQRVAVLAPSGPLGDIVLTAARDAAGRQGFQLAGAARYLPQGSGIDSALNSLVQAGKAPAFDAILIPEGGNTLDTILRGLSARGVRPSNIKFLGTGLWDDADLLRRVNLDTAWLASSPPDLTSQFETRFKQTYRYPPPRIASLTYDAVALAVTLATSGRPFDTPTLTSAGGYAGPANGIFRLRANGQVQRGLAVMEVRASTRRVIDPAPSGF